MLHFNLKFSVNNTKLKKKIFTGYVAVWSGFEAEMGKGKTHKCDSIKNDIP